MSTAKALILLLLAFALIIGCGSKETGKTGDAEEVAVTSPGIVIDYSLTVSGIPMMEDMTFNYQFATDGEMGKMTSESIIPAGDQVRTQKLANITDLQGKAQTYMNEIAKTYASVPFPDASTVPPSTGPDATIEVEPTGNTKTILGVECSEIAVKLEVSRLGAGGTSKTAMAGNLWVSSNFAGFDMYQSFQKKMRNAIGNTRLQGSGYLEFLTRSGFSRENLDKLYDEIGGFPFDGGLELVLNQGEQNETKIKTDIKVGSFSADPVQRSAFEVPEDYTMVDLGQVMRPGN